jgi:hypothetical protein
MDALWAEKTVALTADLKAAPKAEPTVGLMAA